MRILQATVLAALGVAIVPGLGSGARAAGPRVDSGVVTRSVSSTTVSHGLKIVLSIPAPSYPLDSLVLTTITIQNVTHAVIQVMDSPCSGQFTYTQVLNPKGKPYAWPLPSYPLPCPLIIPTKLKPGKSQTATRIIYLRSGTLRADLTLDNTKTGYVDVTGGDLSIKTYAAPAEHATFASTPGAAGGFTASIWPVPKNAGRLYFASDELCNEGSSEQFGANLPNTWVSTASSFLSTNILGPSCRHEQWHFVAGWLGYPAARLDLSVSTS